MNMETNMRDSINTGQLVRTHRAIAQLYAVVAAIMLCLTLVFCLSSPQVGEPAPCSVRAELSHVYGTLPTDALAFFHRHRMAISVGPRP